MRPYYERGGVTIYHCSAAELFDFLPEQSVDMVMTDPPYPREYLECYRDLAVGAARACKPGAFVYAYVGADSLPDVIARMVHTLDWFFLFTISHGGAWPRVWAKQLMVASKPVLCFTVGKPDPARLSWALTEHFGDPKSKIHHKWEQTEGFARRHISHRTTGSELVADPFIGSGTTLLAARYLGRRAVGCDVDEKACETAARRLAQDVLPLETA